MKYVEGSPRVFSTLSHSHCFWVRLIICGVVKCVRKSYLILPLVRKDVPNPLKSPILFCTRSIFSAAYFVAIMTVWLSLGKPKLDDIESEQDLSRPSSRFWVASSQSSEFGSPQMETLEKSMIGLVIKNLL